MKKVLISLIIFTLIFNYKATEMNASETEKKSSVLKIKVPHVNNSKRIYRALVLKNGLKVLLVSDPKINQSAASIDVMVGSLEDPKDEQGLFHFLEHMLFLGTKKFPKVGQYSAYLKQHGGSSNAYTSEENTNYHFQISHDALEEALDRFSQFFISPVFNEDKANTEVENVNSEHQKNLSNDYWRGRQILRSHYKKEHPANHFSTGDSNTLKLCRRESLLKMFKKYYSSNLMSLCILSNKPLDDIQKLAEKYFTAIPNNTSVAPTYPEKLLDKVNGLRTLNIIPHKNIHQLDIQFALPNISKYKGEQTLHLLGSILGHEGKGTITSILKRKGLISTLSAGGYMYSSYARFSLSMTLTKEGINNIDEILEVVFAYIKLMQKSPFPAYYHNEQKIIEEVDLENHEEQEGNRYVSDLTSSINKFGLEKILTAPRLFPVISDKTEKCYAIAIKALTVNNTIISVITKGQKTDRVEKYYQAKYSFGINEKLGKRLEKVSLNAKLHLPKPNKFIPTATEIIKPRPYLLVFNKLNEIWYEQDRVFNLPKTHIKLQILTNEIQKTVEAQLMGSLYKLVMKESLNEDVYPMQIAGLGYSLGNSYEGINLSFSGYSSRILDFFKFVTSRMKKMDISKKKFEIIKDRLKRSYLNTDQAVAYQQAFLLLNSYNKKTSFSVEEKVKALESITFDDLKVFVEKKLFKKVFIRGSVYGNTKPEDIQLAIEQFNDYLGSAPLNAKDFPVVKISQISKKNPHVILSKKIKDNNSAIFDIYSFGLEEPNIRGAALVLSKILDGPYYAEMRTKQHLGYTVWSFFDQMEHNIYQSFIIQSGTYSADHLLNSSDKFLGDFENILKKLPAKLFENYKKAVIDRKLEKPKSIAAQNNKFFYRAFKKNADFDHVTIDVKAVEKLKKEDVLKLFQKMLNKKSGKRITVLCYAKEHKQAVPDTTKKQIKKLKSEADYE